MSGGAPGSGSAWAIDLDALAARVEAAREGFARAEPFPHAVLDEFLRPEAAEAVRREYAGGREGWTFWHHLNERKQGLGDVRRMGPAARRTIAELQSPAFVRLVERLTGLDGLLADPDLDGGGLQETLPGGFLNVHADFLSHARHRAWSRQVNLLVYLNRDWRPAYGGCLELWDPDVRRCVRRIEPLFNRCVVFRTSARSFHGVPDPVAFPPGDSRKAIALYYFRDEGRTHPLIPTRYVPRPGDRGLARVGIRGERALLWAYAVLKRYTPFGDRVVSRLLRRL